MADKYSVNPRRDRADLRLRRSSDRLVLIEIQLCMRKYPKQVPLCINGEVLSCELTQAQRRICICGGEYIACQCWWSDSLDNVDDELAFIFFLDNHWVKNRASGKILISTAAEWRIDRSKRCSTSLRWEEISVLLTRVSTPFQLRLSIRFDSSSTLDKGSFSSRWFIETIFYSLQILLVCQKKEKRKRNYRDRWSRLSANKIDFWRSAEIAWMEEFHSVELFLPRVNILPRLTFVFA